jgi:hypothetical protein
LYFFTVVEQLVLQILPEDLPWGLAILLSIEDFNMLKSVLTKIPLTPVSFNVITYFLALLIAKQLDRLEETLKKSPNEVCINLFYP